VSEVEVDIVMLVTEDSIVAVETPALEAKSSDKAVEKASSSDQSALSQRVVTSAAVDLKASVALAKVAPIICTNAELVVMEIGLCFEVSEQIEIPSQKFGITSIDVDL
jgi:hypothetical protein